MASGPPETGNWTLVMSSRDGALPVTWMLTPGLLKQQYPLGHWVDLVVTREDENDGPWLIWSRPLASRSPALLIMLTRILCGMMSMRTMERNPKCMHVIRGPSLWSLSIFRVLLLMEGGEIGRAHV